MYLRYYQYLIEKKKSADYRIKNNHVTKKASSSISKPVRDGKLKTEAVDAKQMVDVLVQV